jgi:Mg2+ and Co2+ transporter CorA
MRVQIETLRLFCRQSEEIVEFGRSLSFFFGEMSSGKSSIVELVDYCLGGGLVRTPAITSELVSAQLKGMIGETEVLIERSLDTKTSLEVSWQSSSEFGRETFPIQAGQVPIYGEDVFNFSDFAMKLMGLPILKVRKRKRDPDSNLWRLGLRDFFEFCYLDQRHLDSSLFLMEQPIRAEKSKDVLRFVLGFHSERLNELQNNLSELRQDQRVMRETADQINVFLTKFGFNSQEEIADEINQLSDEVESLEKQIEDQNAEVQPQTTVAEEDLARIESITWELNSKTQSVGEIRARIDEQESLIAEFISMKFKAARTTLASELLGRAAFEACPSCGTPIRETENADPCSLCKSPLSDAPGRLEFETPIIERDLSERIDDLKRSVARLKRSLERQSRAVEELRDARGEIQTRLDSERRQVESEYMKRARRLEGKLGGVRERIRLLNQVKKMPAEVASKRKQADELNIRAAEIQRQIQEEEDRFETGRDNIRALEANFHGILQAIHFPEISEGDLIRMNLRSWMPYVYPGGREDRAWTFYDAGSGGKMVLFKISFALALHLTAAQRGLPLPSILIIDSTMKNITPDVNPEVFKNFYRELYRLLETELEQWQMVLIDQTFAPPPDTIEGFISRKLTTSDENYPPLISYYRGH